MPINLNAIRTHLKAWGILAWKWGRIPTYLALTLAVAYVFAYGASFVTGWTYQHIIGGYRAMDHVFRGTPNVLPSAAPFGPGELFAGIAVGASVIVTWFKELLTSVKALWPWNSAGSKKIWTAVVAVFASGLGLFISAFAVENAKPSQELTVAFDNVALPPVAAAPQEGLVSFYIPFNLEGSYGAMARNDDPSISVPDAFTPFLTDLGAELKRCVKNGADVSVSIKGFASVTKWYAIESDTAARKMPEIRDVLRALYKNEQKPPPSDTALAALMEHFTQSRAKIAERAEAESRHKDPSTTPWPDAFNLWLAEKRRDAVVTALDLDRAIKVNAQDWETYDAMRTALAVDDRATVERGTRGGLLSRSVRIAVMDAGQCNPFVTRQSATLTTQSAAVSR